MQIGKSLSAAALLSAALAAPAWAESPEATLTRHVMFGINRTDASLTRYDFNSRQRTLVGAVRSSSGSLYTNIDAAAYFPGFHNIYALWTNGSDKKNRLLYVDIRTGVATVVSDDVEGGRFGGAVGLATPQSAWTLFAVQHEKVKPPAAISGLANINPNNRDDHEFSVTRGDGSTFTRDQLHQDTKVDSNGTYYQGPASRVRMRPKGNGNQNSLLINGEAFSLQNSNTYDFSGEMQVRVFNDKISSGKAMGHWWIEVISGTVIVNNDVKVLSPHRLAKVDQRTGVVTEIMPLSRAYSSLASEDGAVFYATSGADLYRIDIASLTESRVGTAAMSKVFGMECLGGHLFAYDTYTGSLGPLNGATGQLVTTPMSLGMGDLGAILFTPLSSDPALWPAGGYD